MGFCLNSILDVGDIIIIDGIHFRVLSFQKETVLINIEVTRYDIRTYDMDIILEGIRNGSYVVIKKDTPNILIDDEDEIYIQRQQLICDIGDKYHGDYVAFVNNRSKEAIDLLKKKHTINTEKTVMHIVRIYMQSGYDMTSLMPNTHGTKRSKRHKGNSISKTANSSGKKSYIMTIKDKEALEYAIKTYVENDEILFEEAYWLMLYKYYSHTETDPETCKTRRVINGFGECPSFKQLEYMLSSSTTALIKKRRRRKKTKDSIAYINPQRLEQLEET